MLKEFIFKCTKCDLYRTKLNYVVGEGDTNANIMFIGESPGAKEDKLGRPFAGRAGGILDELLASIDLERSDIYICNILKCHPPQNRNPKDDEIKMCTPFLDKQIEIISPNIICCLGNFSTAYILKKYGLDKYIKGISVLHGQKFNINTLNKTITIIPLYHPAMASYNPNMKETMLEDFKLLKNEP